MAGTKTNIPLVHSRVKFDDVIKKLMFALLFVSVYSIIVQSIFNGIAFGLKATLILLTSSYVAYETEIFSFTHLYHGETRETAKVKIRKSYPIITGLILGLTLPVGTPLWIVAIGSFVAIFLGKMVFGGFSKNIFNPALVGRVFMMIAWPALLGYGLSYAQGDYFLALFFNIDAVDTIAGATLGSGASFNSFGNEFLNLLFGFSHGAIGEVSRVAIIISLVYLIINKVIDPRLSLSMIFTVFFMFLIVYKDLDYFVLRALTEVFLGGLLFGAVFMASDPVTTPSDKLGKYIFGIGAGVIVVFIRTVGSWPEGVLFSILFMNMLTPLISSSTMNYNYNKKARIIKIILGIALIIGISLYLGTKI